MTAIDWGIRCDAGRSGSGRRELRWNELAGLEAPASRRPLVGVLVVAAAEDVVLVSGLPHAQLQQILLAPRAVRSRLDDVVQQEVKLRLRAPLEAARHRGQGVATGRRLAGAIEEGA